MNPASRNSNPINGQIPPPAVPPSSPKPEMMESIPVKAQEAVDTRTNPISSPRRAIDGISTGPDKELEHALKDASQNVDVPTKNQDQRFSPPSKKGPKKDRRIAHFLPAIAAFLVAGALTYAAFYTYQQEDGSKSQDLSDQVDGDESVSPGSLQDFYQTASTQLNGLNDEQDFSQAELSDEKLGL